jgi:hypothetical protein
MRAFPYPELDLELVAKENLWDPVQRIDLDATKVANLLAQGEKLKNEPPTEVPQAGISLNYSLCFLTIKEPMYLELLEMTKGKSPIRSQGYLVLDSHSTRIKVKSPVYTFLAELEQEHVFDLTKNKEKIYLLLVRYSQKIEKKNLLLERRTLNQKNLSSTILSSRSGTCM